MGILNELLARVRSVNDGLQSGSLVRGALLSHPDDILDLQREQLFEGKRPDGEDIRPYYSEDLKPGGYFHSVESAKRYADWKLNGISYPYSARGRNADAPNLYINGRFHDEIGVQFGGDSVGIVPATGYAQNIMAKYGLDSFGLSPERWNEIFENRGAYRELMDGIKQLLYE